MTLKHQDNAKGMRMLATGLLILMAVLFVLIRFMRHSYPWPLLDWIEAFAEAAMVGALADWFAVTALFRHPLGIPIPHTAIVSANKDRIAESLGDFVQSNFLSADIFGRKLEQLDIGARVSAWLSDKERTRESCERFVSVVPELLRTLDDTDLRRFLRLNLSALRKELRIANGISMFLRALIEGDRHQKVFNEGLRLAEKLFDQHQEFLRETLRKELPWYVPGFIHNKVYHDVVKHVRATLNAINNDPHHPVRHTFAAFLKRLIEELKTSPELEARSQEILSWVFESSLLADYADSVWAHLKEIAIKKLAEDNSGTVDVLQKGLAALGNALAQDERIRIKLNRFIVATAQRFAQEYQHQIAALITDTVKNWDAKTVVAKIEEQVGRDLQYIRINGTLVGGLVGLVIHAASLWLP